MNIIEVKESEKIKDKYNPNGMDYTIPKKVIINITSYYKLGFNNHFGNCKVCSIESLQVCLENDYDNTIKRLRELFDTVNKLCFFCTFNHIDYVKDFKKQFDEVYCIKIPIGYGSGFQYHCLFMTNSDYNGKDGYIERIKKEGIELIS